MTNYYKNIKNNDVFEFDSDEDTSSIVSSEPNSRYTLIYNWINSPLNQNTDHVYQFLYNLDVDNNTSFNIMKIKSQKLHELKSLFDKWTKYYNLVEPESEDFHLLDDSWVESNPIDYKMGLKFLDRYNELKRD